MSNRALPPRRLILGLVLAFVMLGAADLYLTWKLVKSSDGLVLEGNPLASWWLVTHGWGGMAAFKLGAVAAVVTETGGLLSHAAVIAREYGIPAVLAVPGATRAIADGDRIVVDGAAGTVGVERRAADAGS